MSKNKGMTAVTLLVGLLSMLLIQTAFAAVSVTADNACPGNTTNENTTVGNSIVNSVSPSDYSAYLLAGGNTKFTVTFTNKGNETLTSIPKVVATPNSQNNINECWIKISPANATISPGAAQNFVIEINVPRDVESGYYQGTIAFTDDLVPGSTQYVNSMQLGISVQAQSKIELQTTYLSDTLEAGKDYNYQIKIKNVATRDITIDPKLGDNNPGYLQAFDNDAIKISAPSTLKAGEITNMTIQVHVPENVTGSYNGYIDMNVNGKGNDGSSPQLSLGFNLWQRPAVPYVKTFNTATDAPITIEVSYMYDSSMGLRISPKKEGPSVELGLTCNSSPVNMTLVKLVESGSPTVGGFYPIWALENGNIYQDSFNNHVETYKVPGATGNWKLTILPKNTSNFGYSVTIGDSNSTK